MKRPVYSFTPPQGSRILNAFAIRSFCEDLDVLVSSALRADGMPVVIGGDCSLLLGALSGARAFGPVGLIHVDGHSDFFHPGNHDLDSRVGAAAGMDLALATGRGEAVLADWDGWPLVEDALVVQIGEREETDPDYAFADIAATAIRRLPVRDVLRAGVPWAVAQALAPMKGERPRLWLHVDVDVLDQKVMPAVDSPGSPGLSLGELTHLLTGLLSSGRLLGIDVTVFDPELDPNGAYARAIVDCLGDAFVSAGLVDSSGATPERPT